MSTILAIETSCDETAISILEVRASRIKILANEVISQIEIHKPYGGVFPNLAKREHKKNLPVLLEKVLKACGHADIDIIAITHGPGLEPALWEGIVFAQKLGAEWKKPVVPINHMEGHIVAGLLSSKSKIQNPKFPVLALLISGGHTELVLMRGWFQYEIVGETRDDAIGEAFDKVARILGLQYPGGPEISKLAEKFRVTSDKLQVTSYKLPRPMLHSHNFDFSFSGLKTAVLYMTQKIPNLSPKIKREIAYEFEEAVTEVLLVKTLAAAKKYGVKSLILGGGVSANTHIQKVFKGKIGKELPDMKLFLPQKRLTTDNALMIALSAGLRLLRGTIRMTKTPGTLKAQGNLRLAG